MANVISGQITVTTAGTAVAGTASIQPGLFEFTPVHGNTGTYCYVGNDGANDVSSSTGYHIKKDGTPLVMAINDLSKVYFDSDTNGDKVAWVRIGGIAPQSYPATA